MTSTSDTRPLVFAVDDERSNAEFVARALRSRYETQIFTDPVEALAAIERDKPVGLVVDYRMPGLNGLELLMQLRRKGIIVAVLMLTAFPEVDEVIYASQMKMFYQLIPKPCTGQFLLEQMDLAVESCLERREVDVNKMLNRP